MVSDLREPKEIPAEVVQAIHYLKEEGGLVEMAQLAESARSYGVGSVAMATPVALALCYLASTSPA